MKIIEENGSVGYLSSVEPPFYFKTHYLYYLGLFIVPSFISYPGFLFSLPARY